MSSTRNLVSSQSSFMSASFVPYAPTGDKKDKPFYAWLEKVGQLVLDGCGLLLKDLPDEDFRTHFGEKTTAAQMAQHILNSLVAEYGIIGLA